VWSQVWEKKEERKYKVNLDLNCLLILYFKRTVIYRTFYRDYFAIAFVNTFKSIYRGWNFSLPQRFSFNLRNFNDWKKFKFLTNKKFQNWCKNWRENSNFKKSLECLNNFQSLNNLNSFIWLFNNSINQSIDEIQCKTWYWIHHNIIGYIILFNSINNE
jgi:hypothetical protein